MGLFSWVGLSRGASVTDSDRVRVVPSDGVASCSARLPVVLEAVALSLYVASLFRSPPATAPQQEADAEVNTETLNKSSGTQAAPTDAASTSKDKEPSTEKSKDSGSVSKLLAFGQ